MKRSCTNCKYAKYITSISLQDTHTNKKELYHFEKVTLYCTTQKIIAPQATCGLWSLHEKERHCYNCRFHILLYHECSHTSHYYDKSVSIHDVCEHWQIMAEPTGCRDCRFWILPDQICEIWGVPKGGADKICFHFKWAERRP